MINKFKNVDDKKIGYFISRLDQYDYNLIRDTVEKHFKELIKKDQKNKSSDINFLNYLEEFDQSDHINLFTKTLSPFSVTTPKMLLSFRMKSVTLLLKFISPPDFSMVSLMDAISFGSLLVPICGCASINISSFAH